MSDTELYEKVGGLEAKTELILTNHLPHLQDAIDKVEEKVDKVDERLWWILGTIILGFIGTLVTMFIK